MFQFPKSEEDWKRIATDFEQKWQFPHCLGAIDGKHVAITLPPGCGSEYFNYKGHHSMVLPAIVDAQYRFILCDFGTNGRVSDGGVLLNTLFYEKLQRKELSIPENQMVRGSTRYLPFVFVADDAFPLRRDMMKPFRQSDLNTHAKKVYNYRVCRARRIVENAFGIMASRFRIFHTAINIEPRRVESVVMASCVLHNFLMTKVGNDYAPTECFDQERLDEGSIIEGLTTEGSTMQHLQRNSVGNTHEVAKRVREEFMEYFIDEGSVHWQNNFIH